MDVYHSILLCILLANFIEEHHSKELKWLTVESDQYEVTVGCDIDLRWRILTDIQNVSFFKIKGENITKIITNGKHTINKTEDGNFETIVLTIKNVTIKDAGLYRGKIDFIDAYRDTNLTVHAFKWMSDIKLMQVDLEQDVTIKWEYVSDAEHNVSIDMITPDKLFPFRTKSEVLVRWKNGVEINRINNDRMKFNLEETNSRRIVMLTLRKIVPDDFKRLYDIVIEFSETCSKSERNVTFEEDLKFQWLHSSTTSTSTIHKDVELVWKYQCLKLANRIIIYKKKMNSLEPKTQIVKWTTEDKFTLDQPNVELIKSYIIHNNNDGELLRLKVIFPTNDDFHCIYTCQVYYGIVNSNESEIQLNLKGATVYSNTTTVSDYLTKDVIFVWHYHYDFPAEAVIFTRTHLSDRKYGVGFWKKSTYFKLTLEDDKRQLQFNISEEPVTNGVEGDVILIWRNVTMKDAEYHYTCQVTFSDGQANSSGISLHVITPLNTTVHSIVQPAPIYWPIGLVLPVLAALVIVLVAVIIRRKRRNDESTPGNDESKPMITISDTRTIKPLEYEEYRAWMRNKAFLITGLRDKLTDVTNKLGEKNVLDGAMKGMILGVAKTNLPSGANMLVDYLSEYGDDSFQKIMEAFESCNFADAKKILELELKRSQRMKDDDYEIWTHNHIRLVNDFLTTPAIIGELRKRLIINDVDNKELAIHLKIGKRTQAIKLLDILTERGTDVLAEINAVLETFDLPKITAVAGPEQNKAMRYEHYKIWMRNKTYLIEKLRDKLGALTQKLSKEQILDRTSKAEIDSTADVNKASGAYKLINLLSENCESMVDKIIPVLKFCGLTAVAYKLTSDLKWSGRMKDDDFELWKRCRTKIVINIQYDLDGINEELKKRGIINDVDIAELTVHKERGKRVSAIKLVDILCDRGKGVLPEIRKVFKSRGFVGLEKDLERNRNVNDTK
ncbi:uncharacterized protein LOC126808709 [Patella vulgata]|uniref:uncharacterized protein LOC126808709 n=1 Tax=Patella vulgata TaxID=6465 RepID=UPI0024A98E17|nr:uncharacterized protein LOC126808709 [Patella vulgata]